MVSVGSMRWAFFLLLLFVVIGQLSEGKRGGSSGSRGRSSARSSSKSSSSKSSWFGGSKSSGTKVSKGKSWWSSSTSSSRSGGGFKSSSGGSYGWSSSNPRPSVSSYSVSRGIFSSSPSTGYYGSSYGPGCGFGGCRNTYIVYHYYPRSHYYSSRSASTTPAPIGPNADQVSRALNSDDTLIYNGTDVGNGTEVMEIADPAKPLVIQDLAFFWDSKYLPSKDTKDCASYTPANANSSISFCDVNEYSRCKRDIKELPSYLPDSIFFSDGTSPSHLAWMCPAKTECCEWECCHEQGMSFGEVTCMVVVACAMFYFLIKCFLGCTSNWREEKKWKAEDKRLLAQTA